MLNLDQAITDWRRKMAAEGINSPELLDELESHLRDEAEQQLRSGVSAPQAFETAVERIGQAGVLKSEFAKAGGLQEAQERLKEVILTLAGVPNLPLTNPMNTSNTNIEARWATYAKSLAFLVPAMCLSTLCAVFMVPKLQQILADTGFPISTEPVFWNLTHSSIVTMLFFREYGVLIAGAIVSILIVLEWRSSTWPRYRRATMGIGAFVLNTVVLIAFFMMFLAALVAAPALSRIGK